MRYCRHFGLAHLRRNKFELPSINAQETLADLIGRYDERGVEEMAKEVFEIRCGVCETAMCGAETVVRIAKALRHIGVDVLQDVQKRPAHKLGAAVRSVPGTDASVARLLPTYAGGDDFVVADDHVRQFAVEATGHRTVSASRAARLVCRAAHERILSPRYLDYRIYRYRVGRYEDRHTESRRTLAPGPQVRRGRRSGRAPVGGAHPQLPASRPSAISP